MDFLDLDISGAAEPRLLPLAPIQPALLLPLGNLELLSRKLQLGRFISDIAVASSDDVAPALLALAPADDNGISEKYAQLSLQSIKARLGAATTTTTGGEPTTNGSSAGASAGASAMVDTSALSARLSRVLAPSIPDTLIREVFSSLDPDTIALATKLEGALARRRFRGAVEADVVKAQAQVLREYAPVVRQFQRLQHQLAALNELHQLTAALIRRHGGDDDGFYREVGRLSQQKKLVGVKRSLLANFRQQFTLNDYEEFVLSQGEVSDPELFTVLARAEAIVERCLILLSMDNPRLGQEIMTKVGGIVDKAHQRVITLTQRTLENYQYALPDRLESLQRCLAYFREKPQHWDTIMGQFVELRQKLVLEDFLSQAQGSHEPHAPTSGDNDDNARPVWLSAHDPIRYIGDLLAYVHAVVVNEHELVITVFGKDVDDDPQLAAVVERILALLSQPLRAKISQLISSSTLLPVVNGIFQLVDLYQMMLAKVMSADLAVIATVRELVKLAQHKLVLILRNRLATIRTLSAAKLELSLDLQPPEWIVLYYSDLLPILDALATATLWNLPATEHDEVLSLVVDQPIDICFAHVSELKVVEAKADELILKANFVDVVLSKTMPIVMLSDKTVAVSDINHQLIQELCQVEFTHLLKKLGTYDYYNVMCMISDVEEDDFMVEFYQLITENQLFTPTHIEKVDATLGEYLPTALLELQDKLMKLNLPMSVADVLVQVGVRFCRFYFKFSAVVQEYLNQQLTWTDAQVATMLAVERDYLPPLTS